MEKQHINAEMVILWILNIRVSLLLLITTPTSTRTHPCSPPKKSSVAVLYLAVLFYSLGWYRLYLKLMVHSFSCLEAMYCLGLRPNNNNNNNNIFL